MSAWEMICLSLMLDGSEIKGSLLEKYLDSGWEPFAVTIKPHGDLVWLKRLKVKV